jgi:hypothetical protein
VFAHLYEPRALVYYYSCNDPEYIVRKREASKYIIIRENSLEYNVPVTITKPVCACNQYELVWYTTQDFNVLGA